MRTLAAVLLLALAGAVAAAAPAPAPSAAPTARPAADDPALEKRLIALTRELRCLVCQNESIADSHAPLAVDMRNQIREQLRGGMSDRQVIEFMVARYGDFVRFRPPLQPTTVALWFGPALMLLAGLVLLAATLRRRARTLAQRRATGAPLSDAERAQLARLDAPGGAGEGAQR